MLDMPPATLEIYVFSWEQTNQVLNESPWTTLSANLWKIMVYNGDYQDRLVHLLSEGENS